LQKTETRITIPYKYAHRHLHLLTKEQWLEEQCTDEMQAFNECLHFITSDMVKYKTVSQS